MDTPIDLSGEDDVYAHIHRDHQPTTAARPNEIRIVSDGMPTAWDVYLASWHQGVLFRFRPHHSSLPMARLV